MNEHVQSDFGVLVDHDAPFIEQGQLLAPHLVAQAPVKSYHICKAVERALSLSVSERKEMGDLARKHFELDLEAMKDNIAEIYRDAVFHLMEVELDQKQSAWIYQQHILQLK
ncbi:UNVERIFIED_CONTAM: hypothetical protein HDU68_012193 [Siphonaria sp. JEL0065]|nr:hypothetical protein HDU68_012193 [Siphonaria sp. JEL0065]